MLKRRNITDKKSKEELTEADLKFEKYWEDGTGYTKSYRILLCISGAILYVGIVYLIILIFSIEIALLAYVAYKAIATINGEFACMRGEQQSIWNDKQILYEMKEKLKAKEDKKNIKDGEE